MKEFMKITGSVSVVVVVVVVWCVKFEINFSVSGALDRISIPSAAVTVTDNDKHNNECAS